MSGSSVSRTSCRCTDSRTRAISPRSAVHAASSRPARVSIPSAERSATAARSAIWRAASVRIASKAASTGVMTSSKRVELLCGRQLASFRRVVVLRRDLLAGLFAALVGGNVAFVGQCARGADIGRGEVRRRWCPGLRTAPAGRRSRGRRRGASTSRRSRSDAGGPRRPRVKRRMAADRASIRRLRFRVASTLVAAVPVTGQVATAQAPARRAQLISLPSALPRTLGIEDSHDLAHIARG